MKFLKILSILTLLLLQLKPIYALETSPSYPLDLIEFSTQEGLDRFSRSTGRIDFPSLANQFEAQTNAAFCGPTSAAIVLNTIYSRSAGLPVDRSRLRMDDLKHISATFDPAIARYTQDNVITKGKKTRAQVLGEPTTINGKKTKDFGYQIRQFDEMLSANGLNTHLVVVTDDFPESAIRKDLIENLKRADDYAIVNYKRSALGQKGGGHISPLGAYDETSDSFLVLDVNPASAGWVWVKTTSLIKGMRTFDTVENRGYILISAP